AALCCVARTAADIEATVEAIRRAGGRATAVVADVTDLAEVRRALDVTSAEFGGLDLLVANAGGNLDYHTVEESYPVDWVATIQVNLFGAYYCAREAIPHMKRRGAGKIIFVSSGVGHRGFPATSAYACSKAGVWMLT